MPTLVGFGTFAALPEEQISEKISRRILSGDQGMLVWWSIGGPPRKCVRQLRVPADSIRSHSRPNSDIGVCKARRMGSKHGFPFLWMTQPRLAQDWRGFLLVPLTPVVPCQPQPSAVGGCLRSLACPVAA
jgi:hypothetical protein